MTAEKFFPTWARPEYQEWATPTDYGYELNIICVEKKPRQFLVVKAKLIMGEKGLPGFEVIEEHHFASAEQAAKQIQAWTGIKK